MDRATIKENAKLLLSKNHWLCVAVAFLGTLTIGGYNFNISSSDSESFNEAYENSLSQIDPTQAEIVEDIFDIILSPEFMLMMAIISLISTVIAVVLRTFVTNQFLVGSCRFFLKFRQNNPVSISEVFQNYKDRTFLNIAKITFLRDLYISLWTLLFMVPGIIKSLEYFAVDYILAVRPDIDKDEAFTLSKKMMDGHKGDLFVLNLSFIGWSLLSIVFCGLPIILYVNPYMMISRTLFFCEVREESIRRGIITESDVPDYTYLDPNAPFVGYYQPPYTQGYTTYTTPPYQQNTYQQTPYQQPFYQPEQVKPQYNGSYTQPDFQAPASPTEAPAQADTENDTPNSNEANS